MSPGFRPAVATWYSSGWKVLYACRSTSVMSTGARCSALTAERPPKPPPRMTTCGRVWRVSHVCRQQWQTRGPCPVRQTRSGVMSATAQRPSRSGPGPGWQCGHHQVARRSASPGRSGTYRTGVRQRRHSSPVAGVDPVLLPRPWVAGGDLAVAAHGDALPQHPAAVPTSPRASTSPAGVHGLWPRTNSSSLTHRFPSPARVRWSSRAATSGRSRRCGQPSAPPRRRPSPRAAGPARAGPSPGPRRRCRTSSTTGIRSASACRSSSVTRRDPYVRRQPRRQPAARAAARSTPRPSAGGCAGSSRRRSG